MTKEGSFPAFCKITVTIEVVVVLPCVPATEMAVVFSSNSASAIALLTTGIPSSVALTTSGLS